jgi:hypothetical protein
MGHGKRFRNFGFGLKWELFSNEFIKPPTVGNCYGFLDVKNALAVG